MTVLALACERLRLTTTNKVTPIPYIKPHFLAPSEKVTSDREPGDNAMTVEIPLFEPDTLKA